MEQRSRPAAERHARADPHHREHREQHCEAGVSYAEVIQALTDHIGRCAALHSTAFFEALLDDQYPTKIRIGERDGTWLELLDTRTLLRRVREELHRRNPPAV